MVIGDTGDGELFVEGGLTLTADRFDIGNAGFGTLNVSGANSVVHALGHIEMGIGAGAEVNIFDGGEVVTNTIAFGVNDEARMYITGAGSNLQANSLTYGITSFAEAQVTGGATADIFNLNILSTGANTINFLVDDASVMTDGTLVNATNANLTIANNSSLTTDTSLVLQKGVIRVTDNSTLSTTANNFMATGGQLWRTPSCIWARLGRLTPMPA